MKKQMVNEVIPEPPPTYTPDMELEPEPKSGSVVFNMPSSFKRFHDQKVTDKPGGPIGADFVNYLMEVENSVRKGFKNGKWYPHPSVEGGTPTIAYGHKLKTGENFNAGITEQEAMALLIKDIRASETAAANFINREFGNGTWSKLSTNQKEMLTDFAFNGVLDKFPLFREAVIKNDTNTMKAQYKRYSKGKELTNRNAAFFARYLSF